MNVLNRLLSRFNFKMMSGENWKRGFLFPGTGEKTTKAYAQSALVYAAIRAIATNLPQVELKFWYPDSEEMVPTSHQLYRLFKRPNQDDTYYSFFEKATTWLALTGECFIWRRASAGGDLPSELHILCPYLMKEIVSTDRRVLLGWNYDTNIPIAKEELFFIKFINPYSNFRGLAPLDSVIADVDADYLSAKYGKNFFSNSAVPGIVFTTSIDDESTPEQRKGFLNEWNALHQGATQAHKAAVLAAGMGVQTIGLDQKAMQYTESRSFNGERVLSAFNVPPPMVGLYSQATYGNIRTAKKIFWNECIKTYAFRFESEFNKWLMDKYQPDIECYFDFSGVDELKKDEVELAQVVNTYAMHGVPMNDLIVAFDLPFDKVEGLDVGYYPMSMIPIGTTINDFKNESTPPKNDPEEPKDDETDSQNAKKDKNFTNLFVKELKNYFFNQRSKICEFIAKNEKNGTDVIRNGIVDLFKGENQRLCARMTPVYAQIGGKLNLNVISINITTKRQVLNVIETGASVPEILTNIKGLYNRYNKALYNGLSRVEMIAKAEIELIGKKEQN